MQELDLGLSGGPWKQEHETHLLQAIFSSFNDNFPFFLKNSEIYERLIKEYEVKGYNGQGRRKDGIIERIKQLRNEEIYPDPFMSKELLVLPEWFSKSSVHTIKSIRGANHLSEDWFKQLFNNKNDKEHTLSEVRLKQCEDETVFFSFPRILYADYSLVFDAVYSQKDIAEKMEVKLDANKFVSISLDAGDNGMNNLLRLSAFFLLDYIIGYIASGETKVTPGQIDKLEKALKKMNWLGYRPNDELMKKIKDNNKYTQDNCGEGEDLIDIVNNIFLKNKERPQGKIVLPEYSFSTTSLFELYTYAVLKRVYPQLTFKPNLHEPLSSEDRDKTCRREPDMVDSRERIVFDAKYKYEYGEAPYCDIKSVNRMGRYLLLLNRCGDWFSNYFGCFVYPSMNEVNLNDNINQFAEHARRDVSVIIEEQVRVEKTSELSRTRSVIAKIGIPFPVRIKKNHH